MSYKTLDHEIWAQYTCALDGQKPEDYRAALELRADDIASGRNYSECPEDLRMAVAAVLRERARTQTLPCAVCRGTGRALS